MNRDIKLVAVDFDGTLLSSDTTISKRNINAINELIKRGVHIVPASGRACWNTKALLDGVNIKYIIGSNGAQLRDVEEEADIDRAYINYNFAADLVDELEKEIAVVHASINNEFVRSGTHVNKFDEAYKFNHMYNTVDNLSDYLRNGKRDCSKLGLSAFNKEVLNKAMDLINSYDSMVAFPSAPLFLEINVKEATKGKSLEKLGNHLNIDRKNIAAIGDHGNDYSMLKYAGYGVAMGNAEKEIKEIADEITLTNDEDGVAVFLEKLIEKDLVSA